jgi:hypothetical protein
MRAIATSLALLAMAMPIAAQGLKAYLPAASASKASSYLAVVDAANSGIRSRRAAARAEQLEAEKASLAVFALLYAAEGGEAWADPDGAATSSAASSAFAEARSRALGAASSLASGASSAGSGGTSELERKRSESASKLGEAIGESKPAAKAAAGVEKLLSDRIKDLGRLFPEIVEVQALLRKAGTAGCLLSARAMSGGSAELAAASYVESADGILAAAPAAARAMESLAAAYAAYAAWMSGFALAASPGELAAPRTEGPEPLARGIAALATLGPARAASLVSAMELGDGRDAAAASAARRLAAAWESLGASRRRELASECGVQSSAMAAFASALVQRPARDEAKAGLEPGAIMTSLNALASGIADEEARGSRSGPEPSLLLLEKPPLASAAAAEPRYSSLWKQCEGRLGAIYRRAAEDAAASLETLPSTSKAAARALGAAPTSVVVESVDIGPEEGAFGRVLAFAAVAKGPDERIVRFPIRAELAADAYARSFAKAAGLAAATGGPSSTGTQRILARFAQTLVTAYDPARARGRIVLASYPKADNLRILSTVDMDRAILEGWNP